MTSRRDFYRVGWICALPKEMAAARLMLDEVYPPLPPQPRDTNTYLFGRIANHGVVVASLPSGRTGTTPAASVASRMRQTFPQLEIRLLVGVGGGAPSEEHDIRLGDVVVSSPTGDHGQYASPVPLRSLS